MKIGDVDVIETANATFKDFREDDLQGAAAEVAYNILFSIVPLLIFLTALSAFVARGLATQDPMTGITDWLFNRSGLPREAADTLRGPIEDVIRNQSGGLLSFGALLALWSGKNAVSSLMKALNVAFDVKETRPFWKTTAIAIGLTIALGVGIVGSSLLLLAGGFLGQSLANLFGLGGVWEVIWGLLRIVLIPVVLALALAFLYWAGPNVSAPFKWLTPGAILAVVLWVVATLGLGVYFRFAGGYVSAYGVLGALLAFLFWIYVMSLILLIGGELNSVLARSHDRETAAQTEGRKGVPDAGQSGDAPAPDAKPQDAAPAAPRRAVGETTAAGRGPLPSPKTLLTSVGAAALAAAVAGRLRRPRS